NRYFELIEDEKFTPSEIDWFVCHYSSHIFRSKIIELLEKGSAMIPEDRWFTNLYTKGNTGAASILIMLEELFNSGKLRAGQKILCMVPESGRFVVSFMWLTVVDPKEGIFAETVKTVEKPERTNVENQTAENKEDVRGELWRRLTNVWIDFESRLNQIP